MAMAGGGDADRDGFSEINVTPLTDVLLVLLIIFLITGSSITAPAHDIQLPDVITKEKASNANIVIDVTPKGKTFVGEQDVAAAALQPYLEKLAKQRQTDRVIINADQETPYAAVMGAMEAARNAGLQNIALATEMDKSVADQGEAEAPKKVEVKK